MSPGERTEPLFTKVTFSTEMGNLYQGSRAEIAVLAQATQVANNGETALEADGWPVSAMEDDNTVEEGGAAE